MCEDNRLFPNKCPKDMLQASKEWLVSQNTAIQTMKGDSIKDDIAHAKKYGQAIKSKVGNIHINVSDLLKEGKGSTEIYDILLKEINSAFALKYYLALWQIACEKGNRHLCDVKASEVISIATGRPATAIRQRDRIELTKFILAWNKERRLSKITNVKPTKRKGKKCHEIEHEIKFFKLFELDTVYLKTLVDENGKIIQKSSIRQITGSFPKELFFNEKNKRLLGAFLPKTVFKLNGNEEARLHLALSIWASINKRHNMLKDIDGERLVKVDINWDRSQWIKEAGLEQTDLNNKSVANSSLINTFQRLKELNIIDKFPDELPLSNNSCIKITCIINNCQKSITTKPTDKGISFVLLDEKEEVKAV